MARRTPALVIIGAVVGIPVLAIGILVFTPLGTQLKDTIGEDYVIEKSVDVLVSNSGVHEALKTSYSAVETDTLLYGSLWLADFDITETTVTHTYQYRAELSDVSDVFDPTWDREYICGLALTKRFMAYGATFTNEYVDQSNVKIGSVTMNAKTCDITLF